jgi:hypothetical protein
VIIPADAHFPFAFQKAAPIKERHTGGASGEGCGIGGSLIDLCAFRYAPGRIRAVSGTLKIIGR